MTIVLAPMEGLLDFTLRDILTRVGGIDRCISEFIRVNGTLLPERLFLRIVPELAQGGCTPSGVPVRAQLLGSDPNCLAENAQRLAALGPAGIDLNFGCPAKTVNRHRGGAVLLDDPELLTTIVSAVRRAVPPEMTLSAKMRLGFNDDHRTLDCALAIAAGGADEIAVHARTKAHGYRPPVYWEHIAKIHAAVSIPIIANGDIFSVEDAMLCRERSHCHALMLGRGMVSDPGLARAIVAADTGEISELSWVAVQPLLRAFWLLASRHFEERGRVGRLKQWLKYLGRRHPEAHAAFALIRPLTDPVQIALLLDLAASAIIAPHPPPLCSFSRDSPLQAG